MDEEKERELDSLAEPFLWKNVREEGNPYGWYGWPGWFRIVRGLLRQAYIVFGEYDVEEDEHRLPDGEPPFVIDQVKEKLGGLRFYVTYLDDCTEEQRKTFNGMIRLAGELSYRFCQRCEKPGKLRMDLGWKQTLCDEHHEEALQEEKERIEKCAKRASTTPSDE